MVNINVICILTVKVLLAIICITIIYTFNTFNKQADNENNSYPTPITHFEFLRFLLIKFFIITIVA